MNLIIYSKPDCCLCDGLLQKLEQIQDLDISLEIRDITTDPNWFDKYQYEVPVLCILRANKERELPRLSPRSSVIKLKEMLSIYN